MKEFGVRKVELFDTSLRDGLQQPNIDISVPNAVSLLERMAAFGVHYAEIGFAGSNQFVGEVANAVAAVDTGAMKLALFGRTRGAGAKVREWPDVQFILNHKKRVPVAVLVVKSRLLDVMKSLETTPEENLLMAYETIACLQDSGLEVIVDLEHAMDAACGRRENGNACEADFGQRSLDYFQRMIAQCARQQVSRIIVCDTTGGASPEEVSLLFSALTQSYPEANFGFHGHTDRGFGIANSRAAILAGAAQIQGTLLGTGERCGNVNLTTVIGSMQLRHEAEFVTPESLTGLTGLAHSAYAAFGLEAPHGAPIVGPGAFGTWAGMHGSSERKNPGAYLWCDPALSRRDPGDRRQRTIGPSEHHASLGVAGHSAGLRAGANADGYESSDDGRRRIHGQRGFSFKLACMKALRYAAR